MRKNKTEQFTEIKTVRYWHENRQIMQKKKGSIDTHLYVFGYLIYKKDGTE